MLSSKTSTMNTVNYRNALIIQLSNHIDLLQTRQEPITYITLYVIIVLLMLWPDLLLHYLNIWDGPEVVVEFLALVGITI